MTAHECFRCKTVIEDGDVIRLNLVTAVYFDPTCWADAIDEAVEELVASGKAAKDAVRTEEDEGVCNA